MSTYQREIPCIFIWQGQTVNEEELIELARTYSESGACELLVFDLSSNDEEHDVAIDLMKKMNRVIHIPMIAGGNVKRLEDVKKIFDYPILGVIPELEDSKGKGKKR